MAYTSRPTSKGYHTVDILKLKSLVEKGLVEILAEGDDGTIDIKITPKGQGYVIFDRVKVDKIENNLNQEIDINGLSEFDI